MVGFVDVKIIRDPRDDTDHDARSFTGQTIPVEQSVAERLIQEEVWAQTFWPPNEKPLSQILAEYEESRPRE